jgi:hypothetical protein
MVKNYDMPYFVRTETISEALFLKSRRSIDSRIVAQVDQIRDISMEFDFVLDVITI